MNILCLAPDCRFPPIWLNNIQRDKVASKRFPVDSSYRSSHEYMARDLTAIHRLWSDSTCHCAFEITRHA